MWKGWEEGYATGWLGPLLARLPLLQEEVNLGTAFGFSLLRDYGFTDETSKYLPVTVQIPHLAFNSPYPHQIPFFPATLASSLSPKHIKLSAISVPLLLLRMPSFLLSFCSAVLT